MSSRLSCKSTMKLFRFMVSIVTKITVNIKRQTNCLIKITHTAMISWMQQQIQQTGYVDKLPSLGLQHTAMYDDNQIDILSVCGKPIAINALCKLWIKYDQYGEFLEEIIYIIICKFLLTQELILEGLDLHLQFAENMLNQIIASNFPSLIVLSNETF